MLDDFCVFILSAALGVVYLLGLWKGGVKIKWNKNKTGLLFKCEKYRTILRGYINEVTLVLHFCQCVNHIVTLTS